MPTAVGEEIRPAGTAIGLPSWWERSLKGRGFPDDHVIRGAELAGGKIGDTNASGGKKGDAAVIGRFRRHRGRKVAGGGREYTLEARRSWSRGVRRRL